MNTHFTAWVTTTTDCLTGDYCAVTVLEDEEAGCDDQGTEIWISAGTDPALTAVTTVRHDADAHQDVLDQSETLLEQAGWSTLGKWEAVPTGYVTTVERNQ